MGLLSILPDQFVSVETWLTRFFLLMGVIMIGPWVCLLVYDLFLYIARSITHEIPVVGGRAQGKARPRAPSLTERPSGHRRKFSLTPRRDLPARSSGDHKANVLDPRWRNIREESDESDSPGHVAVFE
ncbi:hypothetical protein K458DRAFT_401809 [Lentithecium fluviatile CBS 122367]|uniref:Uncharacterized protein n=1 Tax=Lentithecium fluviatile CBS 122367 TaxID=1168545 RepID=A0A6G1J9P3_9PLEO|nr:hypothetical protein K458DRAFT_401809 [Lentithecium fluviatile CBS 122367]